MKMKQISFQSSEHINEKGDGSYRVGYSSLISDPLYTDGNKLGNTCNNVTTNFGLYISFFVRIMKNVLTT